MDQSLHPMRCMPRIILHLQGFLVSGTQDAEVTKSLLIEKKGVMNSLISNRPLSDYHKLTSFILGSKAEGIKQKK